jgi:hypothetical protein
VAVSGSVWVGANTPNSTLDWNSGYGFLIDDNVFLSTSNLYFSGATFNIRLQDSVLSMLSFSRYGTFGVGVFSDPSTAALAIGQVSAEQDYLLVSDRSLVVDASGFIGIGMVAPEFELDVRGMLKAHQYESQQNGNLIVKGVIVNDNSSGTSNMRFNVTLSENRTEAFTGIGVNSSLSKDVSQNVSAMEIRIQGDNQSKATYGLAVDVGDMDVEDDKKYAATFYSFDEDKQRHDVAVVIDLNQNAFAAHVSSNWTLDACADNGYS